MRNVEGLTKPLGERGPGLVDEFDASMKKLNLLSDNLLRFSQQLNDPQGSLGALLHDKELYQHVNHMAKNLDDLTRDLKPILNNVPDLHRQDRPASRVAGRPRGDKKDTGLKDILPTTVPNRTSPQTRRWPLGGSGQWSIGGNGSQQQFFRHCGRRSPPQYSSSSVVGPPLIGRRGPGAGAAGMEAVLRRRRIFAARCPPIAERDLRAAQRKTVARQELRPRGPGRHA